MNATKFTPMLETLDRLVREAENRCETARTMRGADARRTDLKEIRAARSSALELYEVLRLSAEALESAAKCVGPDLAIVLRDRAMFARDVLPKAVQP